MEKPKLRRCFPILAVSGLFAVAAACVESQHAGMRGATLPLESASTLPPSAAFSELARLDGLAANDVVDLVRLTREIAQVYGSWGRVEDNIQWAPTGCLAPPVPQKEGRISRASGEESHARKLYFLYAKNKSDYLYPGKAEQLIGQVIVKEAFEVEEISPDPSTHDPSRYAKKDGKVFKPGKFKGLFIMVKLHPDTLGTDDGWVYMTTEDDGITINNSGLLKNCMKCHDDPATHDRLFGVKMR